MLDNRGLCLNLIMDETFDEVISNLTKMGRNGDYLRDGKKLVGSISREYSHLKSKISIEKMDNYG